MNHFARHTLSLLAGISLGGLLVTGCSDSYEDVRITMCKNLTASLAGSPQGIEWTEPENRFQRPEYAAITVGFENQSSQAGNAQTQATCYFEYNAVEEDAMTHSNPLSAYSTLPYKMTLNGKPLSDPALAEAVKAEQIRMGKAVVDGVRKAGEEAVQHVKEGLGNAQPK